MWLMWMCSANGTIRASSFVVPSLLQQDGLHLPLQQYPFPQSSPNPLHRFPANCWIDTCFAAFCRDLIHWPIASGDGANRAEQIKPSAHSPWSVPGVLQSGSPHCGWPHVSPNCLGFFYWDVNDWRFLRGIVFYFNKKIFCTVLF